jgi:hypothetical protein
MKVETKLSLEGKTKIVEATNFPLKIEVYKEVFAEDSVEGSGVRNINPRGYVALVRFREDVLQLTGDCVDEVAWKVGRVLLALLGEVKE